MSCQKEETTDKDCCVCRGCTQWQEGRWICCHCCCCCCYSQELHIISPLGGQIEGWLLHWWVQAGTLPCLKLTEWALTVWRVPRSAPRDRVATADCCIWPTYSSHRGGQNGLDYLSLSCSDLLEAAFFHETLGSLSHPLPSVPHSATSQAHCWGTWRNSLGSVHCSVTVQEFKREQQVSVWKSDCSDSSEIPVKALLWVSQISHYPVSGTEGFLVLLL